MEDGKYIDKEGKLIDKTRMADSTTPASGSPYSHIYRAPIYKNETYLTLDQYVMRLFDKGATKPSDIPDFYKQKLGVDKLKELHNAWKAKQTEKP